MIGRFKLKPSDGVHCYQITIYTREDLNYWENQAQEQGYLIAFDASVPANFAGQSKDAYDIYQIYPPELQNQIESNLRNFKRIT